MSTSRPSLEKNYSLPQRILVTTLKGYRYLLSPMRRPCCRYFPTCSLYAIEAIKTHGALRGTYLSARRLFRCHPWGGSGYDPVPGYQGDKGGEER